MIPADVASRLRLAVPDQPSAPQPVTPARNLGDVLADLVPGQRIMAEIQALLPNGTYRAVIAQREITLALPFSAKPGDSLELEVVDSDGKLTLAVVTGHPSAKVAGTPGESVATTLSRTGQLIGDLLADIDSQGKKPAPAALNGNQPLLANFSGDAAEIASTLKEALGKSGMFYEAHQARWIAGQLPTEQLLQEPQGRHSMPPPQADGRPATSPWTVRNEQPLREMAATNLANSGNDGAAALPRAGIPADLTPLVQQQLESLATQNFTWQGQIWPGQQMHWEIEEQQRERKPQENAAPQWQTRLKLTLPGLGHIDATLRLQAGNQVEISLTADPGSETRLSSAAAQLQGNFENAGLSLTRLSVSHDTADE